MFEKDTVKEPILLAIRRNVLETVSRQTKSQLQKNSFLWQVAILQWFSFEAAFQINTHSLEDGSLRYIRCIPVFNMPEICMRIT